MSLEERLFQKIEKWLAGIRAWWKGRVEVKKAKKASKKHAEDVKKHA